jgi:hypothetical protein
MCSHTQQGILCLRDTQVIEGHPHDAAISAHRASDGWYRGPVIGGGFWAVCHEST